MIYNDISALSLLQISNYRHLLSINLTRKFKNNSFCKFEIEMILYNPTDRKKIKINFYNVEEIKLNNIETLRGIELKVLQKAEFSFFVNDTESETFSFLCESFFLDEQEYK